MIIFILAVVKLTNAITLNCEFLSTNWLFVGSQYSCYNTVFTPDGSSTHVLAVFGDHTNGRNNDDVAVLRVIRDPLRLTRIPKGIGVFFPNLVVLGWSEGYLTTITAEDLQPFQHLQVLSTHHNQLFSLEGDLFRHTPQLVWSHLSYNSIEHVGLGLYDNLSHLSRADMNSNACIDIVVTTQTGLNILRQRLRDQCPPLITTEDPPTTTISTTTESGQCSIGCVGLIDDLRDETTRQSIENEKLRVDMDELKSAMIELQRKLATCICQHDASV